MEGIRHRKPKSPAAAPDSEAASSLPPLLTEQSFRERWKNWWLRVILTFFMLGGFSLLIFAGHIYLTGLVLLIQLLCFKEVCISVFLRILTLTQSQPITFV
eukprot:Sdes_comp15571_c0_seq1m4548